MQTSEITLYEPEGIGQHPFIYYFQLHVIGAPRVRLFVSFCVRDTSNGNNFTFQYLPANEGTHEYLADIVDPGLDEWEVKFEEAQQRKTLAKHQQRAERPCQDIS